MSKIELGPLPEPDVYALGKYWLADGSVQNDAYSADQMRSYAEQEVARERERWENWSRPCPGLGKGATDTLRMCRSEAWEPGLSRSRPFRALWLEVSWMIREILGVTHGQLFG